MTGPAEKWNELYILDGTNFINKFFKIYKINVLNDSDIFRSIKINELNTYYDVCKKGIRPRLSFSSLKKQLDTNIELVYSGYLCDM